jgi:hypothetical protein
VSHSTADRAYRFADAAVRRCPVALLVASATDAAGNTKEQITYSCIGFYVSQQQKASKHAEPGVACIYSSAAVCRCPVVLLAASAIDAAGNTEEQVTYSCTDVYALSATKMLQNKQKLAKHVYIAVQLYTAVL